MDAHRFDALSRSLWMAPSRRVALRLLVGSALGGTLAPLLHLREIEAHDKRKKCKKIEDKDKRKRCQKKAKKHQARHTAPAAFCAGLDFCFVNDGALCDDGSIATNTCLCHVIDSSRDPFCADEVRSVNSCAECGAGETCVDLSQGICGGGKGCAVPCRNPR